jgi:4-hydroxy-tetrahydrodipicolinate synthase
MITPFDAHGRVDSGRIADLVRFQISKGAEGLFPCGSTGLGPMLATEERKTVAEAVIGASSGRVPVVMQVGSADTPSTVALARHAEKAGADAVASLTPYYYHPGELAISKHFEAVSKSVGIPVFAYNIPQFTGNNLRPKSVAGLAKKGTVSGIKDSSRDFLQVLDILDAVSDEFVVMNGIEEYGLFALMSGADGLVSGGASALPELFGSMVSAHRKGDINAALSAQRAVQRVKSIVKSGPISAYYEILRARGMDCGRPRPPFLPLSKSAAAKAVRELRALHLF